MGIHVDMEKVVLRCVHSAQHQSRPLNQDFSLLQRRPSIHIRSGWLLQATPAPVGHYAC